jgi:nitrite transporter NirC
MTLFSIALLGEHPETVGLSGMVYNLLWVTLGNLLSGSLFMALGYWLYSGPRKSPDDEDTNIEEDA